jgi:hypothetical protein
MKNRFKGLFLSLLLGAASLSTAVAASNDISLYTQPNVASRLIAELPYDTRLVPIFEKGDWLKVGDPSDGAVGWINKTQYMKAMQDAVRAHTQTFVFKEKQQAGKPPVIKAFHNGKPFQEEKTKASSDDVVVQYSHQPSQKQPTIIAYENGKQLSPEASKALLDRMNVEGAAMQQHFNQVQHNIQKMFQRSMNDFQQVEDDLALPSQPTLMPLEPGPVMPGSINSSHKALQTAHAKNRSLLPNSFNGGAS